MGRIRGGLRGRMGASEESPAQKSAHGLGNARGQQGDVGEAIFLAKATSLGMMVAKPWGNCYRFDFIVQGGGSLWRVQGKTCRYMRVGLYHLCMHCSAQRRALPYKESEIDFVAAYIIPEETWYIVPVREIVERRTLMFRPRGYPRGDPYPYYREAWMLLSEPDGITFG